MPKIKVEKTVCYLEREKVYSVSLRSVEPYGKHFPRTIYVTAIFHKNRDKAIKKAWDEFKERMAYRDEQDHCIDSTEREVVEIDS